MGSAFSFNGGEKLSRMGASWFVSYCYYDLIDKNHNNWNKISSEKSKSSRKSIYNNSKEFHKFWLEQILKMEAEKLNKNLIELESNQIKTMAQYCLQKF